MSIENRNRIIIALDVQTQEEGITLVSKLRDARMFKVGLELFTAEEHEAEEHEAEGDENN